MDTTSFLRRGLPAIVAVASLLIGCAASVNAQNEELPLVPIILSEPETIASGPLSEAESVNVGVANAVPDVPVVESYPVPATAPATQPQGPVAPAPPPASGLYDIILGDPANVFPEPSGPQQPLQIVLGPDAPVIVATGCIDYRVDPAGLPC